MNETIGSDDGLDFHSSIFQIHTSDPIVSSRLESLIAYIPVPELDTDVKIRLLLDTGSTHSFIRSATLKEYSLPICGKFKIALQPFGSPVDVKEREVAILKLFLKSRKTGKDTSLEMKVISVPQICSHINSYVLSDRQLKELKQRALFLGDPDASKEGILPIDVLVGQDYYHQLISGPNVYLSEGLVLIPTLGDYVLGGSVEHSYHTEGSYDEPINLCSINFIESFAKMSIEEEQQTLDQFMSLENIGINSNESPPVLDFFNRTIKHNGNRYSVELPIKEEKLGKLMTNFPQVFHRLESGWKKLSRPSQKHLRDTYVNIMQDQIDIGVIEEVICLGTVPEIETSLSNNPRVFDNIAASEGTFVHYLPHFPVQKSSDGSFRLVYDAKARPFKGQLCLNDCLEKGPKLINSLVGILIKFRLKRYVCKGDIAKAFLQIEIDPKDRDLLRLLWKKDDKVYIYRFARLPFGLTCSPFILAATLKYHLQNSNLSPEIQKEILDAFYVDDLVFSLDSGQELIDRRLKILKLFSQAGMLLRKWNTNHMDLRNTFLASEENTPNTEPVLGVMWNVLKDQIYVNGERISKKAHPAFTKRGVYSTMAQVFDPLGLLSPFVFLCKLLVRDIWQTNLNWDDPLPPSLMNRWNNWKAELPLLDTVTLPRHVGIVGAEKQRLHGFCDASFMGFGAVIYLVTFEGNQVVSHLITSKTRIAPSKITSVPRLELCSALLLSNLMSSVKEVIPEVKEEDIHFHSDSANVIYWIRSGCLSQPKDKTNFVANRLTKILQVANSEQWHHVGTKDNPADLASRGAPLERLRNNGFWLNGPNFILESELSPQTHVDLKKIPDGVLQESKNVTALVAKVSIAATGLTALIPLNYTNDYGKLIRHTNIVLKAAYIWLEKTRNAHNNNLKSPLPHNKTIKKLQANKRQPPKWRQMDIKSIAMIPELGLPDSDEVELRWIREVQQQHFSDILHVCQGAGEMVSSKAKSQCKNLRIYLDADLKVLRIKTRLPYSELDGAAKNPILLPKDSELTVLIINSVHQRLLHAGVRQTLTALRGEFWFTSGRRKVASVLSRCVICRKATGQAYALPPHPALPDFRVQRDRPFNHVGIDFAGPFIVTQGEEEIKAYVLVITCTTTRAIWLEHTQGLSAYEFLLALKRFVGRRGYPNTIVSDNAKAFKCCHRKLIAIYKNQEVQKYLIKNRINWKVNWNFYCERAPWQGGFIETMVNQFKSISKKIFGSAKMSYLEFATAVVEAEGIINSRPLTYDYSSPDDDGHLSPSKIIYGYDLSEIPPMKSGEQQQIPEVSGTSTLQRYWFLESVKTSMWNRWSKEYLTSLAERHCNDAQKKGVQAVPEVGEVVLLRNEKTPRRKWRLARVLEAKVNPRDGKVRTCVIQTHNEEGKPTILNRSPNFLIPLELRHSEEERKSIPGEGDSNLS